MQFIAYLDSVEPFFPSELTAFAKQAGLAGIRIDRGGDIAEGPSGWFPEEPGCDGTLRLMHLHEENLYLFSREGEKDDPCITIGFDDRHIEALRSQLGLKSHLEQLSHLPGLQYVDTEELTRGRVNDTLTVTVKDTAEGHVAEARLPFNDLALVVGVDADYMAASLHRLWRDFFTFSGSLAALGLILSLVLYRQQGAHLTRH